MSEWFKNNPICKLGEYLLKNIQLWKLKFKNIEITFIKKEIKEINVKSIIHALILSNALLILYLFTLEYDIAPIDAFKNISNDKIKFFTIWVLAVIFIIGVIKCIERFKLITLIETVKNICVKIFIYLPIGLIGIFINIKIVSLLYGGKEIYDMYHELSVSIIWIIISIYFLFFLVSLIILLTIKPKYTVIDLKNIYEDKEYLNNIDLFFVDEDAVDYDLLERDTTINNLFETINSVKHDKSFVISLEGEWGCGKSTIIKSVEKKLNTCNEKKLFKKIKFQLDKPIIINSFDPWDYDDKTSMFKGMLQELLSSIGYPNNSRLINAIVSGVISEYSTNDLFANLGSMFLIEDKGIYELKEKVNKLIHKRNKKIVFVIDNIDRADKENVILLLKTVGRLLSFKNLIYVLSYDAIRVNKILDEEQSVNSEYLKKIINKKISVPILDVDKKIYVMKKCTNSIIGSKYSECNDIEEIKLVLNEIYKIIKDLRDYKMFLNTIFIPVINSIGFDKKDLLIIQFIKYNFNELYTIIYTQKNLSKNISFINLKNDNDDTYTAKYSIYKPLWAIINKNIKSNSMFYNNSKKKDTYSYINSESYFSFIDSKQQQICKKVNCFIDLFKSNNEERILQKKFDELFTKDEYKLSEISTSLNSHIHNLSEDKILMLIKFIINSCETATDFESTHLEIRLVIEKIAHMYPDEIYKIIVEKKNANIFVLSDYNIEVLELILKRYCNFVINNIDYFDISNYNNRIFSIMCRLLNGSDKTEKLISNIDYINILMTDEESFEVTIPNLILAIVKYIITNKIDILSDISYREGVVKRIINFHSGIIIYEVTEYFMLILNKNNILKFVKDATIDMDVSELNRANVFFNSAITEYIERQEFDDIFKDIDENQVFKEYGLLYSGLKKQIEDK